MELLISKRQENIVFHSLHLLFADNLIGHKHSLHLHRKNDAVESLLFYEKLGFVTPWIIYLL